MEFDSGLLRAFVVLAEERHFGRAAVRLGLTQQGLSKRMARLEGQLGETVMDRTDRRALRLTPLGQDILPLARELVDVADRIAARSTSARRIRVDIMGDYLAPQRWTLGAARNGLLPLDVVERPPETTAEHLLGTGAADFAFGRAGAIPRPWPPYLRHRLVLLEPLALFCGPDHPWSARDHVPLDQLEGHELWFPLAAAPVEWRTYLTELAETFHLELSAGGSTFGFQQWADDVATGQVPPSIVGEAMTSAHPDNHVVPLTDPTPTYPWSVFWRDTTPVQEVQTFLTAIGFPHQPPRTPSDVWMPAGDRLDSYQVQSTPAQPGEAVLNSPTSTGRRR